VNFLKLSGCQGDKAHKEYRPCRRTLSSSKVRERFKHQRQAFMQGMSRLITIACFAATAWGFIIEGNPSAVAATMVTVTVKTSPTGRSFSVDGTTYTAEQRFRWTSGSTHAIATTSPQSGDPGVQYVWKKWSDQGAISHTVSPTVNTN